MDNLNCESPLVFISHSSKDGSRDKIIAHAVCGELEAMGLSVGLLHVIYAKINK